VSRTDSHLPRSVMRSKRTPSCSLTVLIEVPELKAHRPKRYRQNVRLRAKPWRTAIGRPRRRLRREVRLAGFALLTLVPLVSLCTLGWSSRPSRIVACSIPDRLELESGAGSLADRNYPTSHSAAGTSSGISSSGMAILSIESTAASPRSQTGVPVFVPGYVLPDDALEDKANAGS
jgi:hypothetical protein